MVIRESIEILREDSSLECFKKEIELLKSAGYKVYEEYEDYVCFYQTATVVDSDLFDNKKCK
ncbi:hypothetical protein [Clostridium sp. C2-6-12]|uniref:hypothetical protein n=1 Tax=Clostridium sp. C2-6-12 TaxID=2698832 RepID=UPI001368F579|nr:hypothetical protein [Clostridium sp. C2-6-12]